MTPTDDWKDIIARITPVAPVDLDTLLGGDSAAAPADAPATLTTRPPSPKLWANRIGDGAHIGIRVEAPAEDAPHLAAHLAAAALERNVIPIILSSCPRSGFERFGFRVERVLGRTDEDRAVMETEIARFWDLAIVIDLADVGSLG